MGGPVDDDMANLVVAQLLYLDSVDQAKDITMYINSPGGSVTAGECGAAGVSGQASWAAGAPGAAGGLQAAAEAAAAAGLHLRPASMPAGLHSSCRGGVAGVGVLQHTQARMPGLLLTLPGCLAAPAGMAVFDTMRHIRPDVSSVCIGMAASMGAFLLASGHQVGGHTSSELGAAQP
jgi:hypothetical protein